MGGVDNRWIGKFSMPDQDATQIRTTGNRMYYPLKRITGLGSSRATTKNLRSTTKNS